MNPRKFDACPNHCILYQGKEYEKLMSCPHCGMSRYKRNAGCHVDVDDKGALRGGPKKKRAKKSSAAERRSRLSRTRKKRVTRRGKVLPYRCGTYLSLIAYGLYLRTPRMPS
jgi:hypothetical protein